MVIVTVMLVVMTLPFWPFFSHQVHAITQVTLQDKNQKHHITTRQLSGINYNKERVVYQTTSQPLGQPNTPAPCHVQGSSSQAWM
jgi:hypothetical protein